MSSFYHAQSGKTFYVGGGIPGRSAYDEAVHLGLFTGTAEEFIASLQGPPGIGTKGDKGDPGDRGLAGPLPHFLAPVAEEADLPSEAEDGDVVLVETTGEAWFRQGGTWAVAMRWVGSPGAPGPSGDPGPAGPPPRFLASVAEEADLPSDAGDGDLVVVEATGRAWYRRDGAWAGSVPWVGPQGESGGVTADDVPAIVYATLGGQIAAKADAAVVDAALATKADGAAVEAQLSAKADAAAVEAALAAKAETAAVMSALAAKADAVDPVFSGMASGVTKAHVGLAEVDNTSDADKPVSLATQAALDAKADAANPVFTGAVSGVTKAHVGLSNVNNTSDANKPVSLATQAALSAKADAAAVTAALAGKADAAAVQAKADAAAVEAALTAKLDAAAYTGAEIGARLAAMLGPGRSPISNGVALVPADAAVLDEATPYDVYRRAVGVWGTGSALAAASVYTPIEIVAGRLVVALPSASAPTLTLCRTASADADVIVAMLTPEATLQGLDATIRLLLTNTATEAIAVWLSDVAAGETPLFFDDAHSGARPTIAAGATAEIEVGYLGGIGVVRVKSHTASWRRRRPALIGVATPTSSVSAQIPGQMAGDLLIAWDMRTNSGSTSSLRTGFTQFDPVVALAQDTIMRLRATYRWATADAETIPAAAPNGATRAILMAFRNVDPGDPFVGAPQLAITQGEAGVIPALTMTEPGLPIVCIFAGSAAAAPNYQLPGGYAFAAESIGTALMRAGVGTPRRGVPADGFAMQNADRWGAGGILALRGAVA